MSRVVINKNIDIKNLAQRTTGFTGADIKNMINIAAIKAVKSKR